MKSTQGTFLALSWESWLIRSPDTRKIASSNLAESILFYNLFCIHRDYVSPYQIFLPLSLASDIRSHVAPGARAHSHRLRLTVHAPRPVPRAALAAARPRTCMLPADPCPPLTRARRECLVGSQAAMWPRTSPAESRRPRMRRARRYRCGNLGRAY